MITRKRVYVILVSSLQSHQFRPNQTWLANSFSLHSMENASRKRKLRSFSTKMHAVVTNDDEELDREQSKSADCIFQEAKVANAKKLTDGINLSANENENIILPFIGYGTYKLGKEIARSKTLEALRKGYRCIDTAFIYGGETIERQVGLAIRDAIDEGILKNGRQDIFLITKQWRKFHGYEPTLQCLNLS